MEKLNITYRKATENDMTAIIRLLVNDELGQSREGTVDDPRYYEAFEKISSDNNQCLMVADKDGEIVGTCHLTIIPSLTFIGATRMQVEAVRIAKEHRNKGIGEEMIKEAVNYGKTKNATIIQLTTHRKRTRAKIFYEKFGFESTHEGMKLYL